MSDGKKEDEVKSQPSTNGEGGITRRNFLKILGTASAVGAVGCADSTKQKVFPDVKGQEERVTGVAAWYRSTCTECTAGCGIEVRVREGRAVKIEGNKEHPVNKGGLCARGHSALQNLYDPDRIRQPLKRDGESYKPISWDEALSAVAEMLGAAKSPLVMTSGKSGSLGALFSEWSKSFKATEVVHRVFDYRSVARASELVYGVEGIPQFQFDKAEVVLNFGADFLETWISPCEYARGWADARRGSHPVRTIHIEPRLSLTGANADHWFSATPGSELDLALAILKRLLDAGSGKNVSSSVRDRLVALTKDIDLQKVSANSGVPKEKILLVAEYLLNAKHSLVVAGGASGDSQRGQSLQVVVAFLNLVLANVGTTVDVSNVRATAPAGASLSKAIEKCKAGTHDLIIFDDSNPAFTLPLSTGFQYAVKAVKHRVSFASHLHETARLADIILPSHTSLESWGDVREQDGVASLVQPSMLPVFDTHSMGDILIQLAQKAGKKLPNAETNFLEYLKYQWRSLHGESNAGGSFENFWLQCVESGGHFAPTGASPVKVDVSSKAFTLAAGAAIEFEANDAPDDGPVLLPYPSVRSFDGSSANRPWLQELPDPITQIVWDSWAEIHPDTAAKYGVVQGDMLTVRNHYGELNVPAYVTEYVHQDVVAVPIGQGHTSYGRFASTVGGGNVLQLLPSEKASTHLLSTRVRLSRGTKKADLVVSQGSNTQMDRHLAQTKFIDTHSDHHDHEAHGHHEPKQVYEQRKHPLYRWAMAVDLAACTGCSACVVACNSENNIPVVGKKIAGQGREMAWLRIERYFDGSGEEFHVSFLPMMCQHCGNAPCEPVCPVYATYHNEEGLNAMIYNRCVGTRYCGNNCSYKVRRFNWFEYDWPEPMNWQLNPDVTKRTAGVMEKCTFCVQRITRAKDQAKDLGRPVQDGDVQPACVQSCPTQALSFGNMNDPESAVSKIAKDNRAYKVLDHHLNTQPAVTYLKNVKYKA